MRTHLTQLVSLRHCAEATPWVHFHITAPSWRWIAAEVSRCCVEIAWRGRNVEFPSPYTERATVFSLKNERSSICIALFFDCSRFSCASVVPAMWYKHSFFRRFRHNLVGKWLIVFTCANLYLQEADNACKSDLHVARCWMLICLCPSLGTRTTDDRKSPCRY